MATMLRKESLSALEDFKKVRAKHEKLKELFDRLEEVPLPSSQGKIFAVVGATGAGKSTAVGHFFDSYNQRFLDDMIQNPGFIPTVLTTLPTGFKGEFDWKDALQRLLAMFFEPLIRKKILPRMVVNLDGEKIENVHQLVTSALARAFKNGLLERETHFVGIDEASSIFATKNDRSYKYQFEILKSIVNDWGLPLILSGAYDLLKIEDFNSQLIRRTKIIHFERYYPNELESESNKYGQSFVNVTHTFFKSMKIPIHDDVCVNYPYLMKMSLGSIGLLKDWCMRALELAFISKMEPIIDMGIMNKTALPIRQLIKIEKENQWGEKLLSDESEEDLTNLLGLNKASDNYKNDRMNGKNIKSRKPGRRNPSRDSVGDL
ncbi:hypothetical protein B0T45_19685 [Chromobacterium haemolyticum]|uniref:ORC1/DEAH AAA+ ATPase domain-containing protein n=2 Tax=Chromobacterium haemolyticum TaxID=394935 RepID=A0A1W0CGG2_9NEIS|nr:hypothetical protein B0T45_19685 [Chromobacterium haemolyticum]